jgi:hypothetical protein
MARSKAHTQRQAGHIVAAEILFRIMREPDEPTPPIDAPDSQDGFQDSIFLSRCAAPQRFLTMMLPTE